MSGFDKTIPSLISEYTIFNANSGEELVKVAGTNIDVPDDFVFDPDYLYLWVRIVSAGEYYGPNKNGDYFPEAELVEYYSSFNNAHAFKNHENKNVEHAIGEIISVRWNPIMKCVEVFKGIDKKRAPEIARGFLKGYLTDVSMGCKVPYTICSICGNKARRRKEFCDHVNKYRMQFLGNGERVFEINYEPNFHDSSTVLTGAERVAKAFMIIESPTEGMRVAFQKVAGSQGGVSRFVRLSGAEIDKVASYREHVHPMLQAASMEKVASHDFITKIAELEKEVTGKLLNIVSGASDEQTSAAGQVVSIIKFLTEKRFDRDTISSLGQTLNNLAKSEGVSPQKAFSTFIGIAELLGIELYPSELHGILSSITDAQFNKDLSVSESNENASELYPSEFASGVKKTLEATEQLPEFGGVGDLVDFYDEGAHQTDMIKSDPFGFIRSISSNDDDMEDAAPVRVVRIIRHTLAPFMPMRSSKPEFLLPRLASALSGFMPIIGGPDARHDFDILANPQTLGDMMATMAYRNYQHMRPATVRTKMIRLAMYNDSELEKIASFADPAEPKGISRWNLIRFGVPTVYAASLFEKSRRDHGRNLSDAENFIADKPGVVASGVVLGGKPLSKAIARGGIAVKEAFKKGTGKVTGALEKESYANEFEAIVKIADSFPAGRFSIFGNDMMAKFSSISGFTSEETTATKVASILSVSGMEKEAQEVLDFYRLPAHAKGIFLQKAAEAMREEIPKVANDFMNNMLIDGVMNSNSLTNTLPGRVVDSFIISKLTKHLGNQTPKPSVPQPVEPVADNQ